MLHFLSMAKVLWIMKTKFIDQKMKSAFFFPFLVYFPDSKPLLYFISLILRLLLKIKAYSNLILIN